MSSQSASPRAPTVAIETDGPRFQPRHIVLISSAHLFVALMVIGTGVALALRWPNATHSCHSYFIIVYLRVAFWAFTYFLHGRAKAECRLLAEDDFPLYRKLATCWKAPLQIVSFFSVFLLAIQTEMRRLFATEQDSDPVGAADVCGAAYTITPQTFVLALLAVEFLLLFAFYLPAMRCLITLIKQSDALEDIRYRTLSDTAEETEEPIECQLERQAAILKNLRADNDTLRCQAKNLSIE